MLNPAVKSMEEAAHVRLAVEGPPAANHRVDPFDHFSQLEGRFPPGEAPDLVSELLDALLARDGIQVMRVGTARALMRRQPKPFPSLDFVAEELAPLPDVDHPRRLRVQGHPEFLSENAFRKR